MPLVPRVAPGPKTGPLPPVEVQALLESARVLRRAVESGGPICLLRDKNLGLMCADEDSAEAALFRRAANGLGARVSHLRPLAPDIDPKVVRDTARMLGRLYDAVECQGLSRALVQAIRVDAGVPVHDAMASLREPEALLVRDALGGSEGDIPTLTLQTLLLSTLT